MNRIWIGGMVIGASLAGAVGCSSKPEKAALKPQEFYSARAQASGTNAARTTPAPAVNSTSAPRTPVAANPSTPRSTDTLGTNGASNGNGRNGSAPAPATQPAVGASSGSYMLVGMVIGEANGTPIYADKVLSAIEPALKARARELNPQQFRNEARRLIKDRVELEVNEELEFAAAERNTTEEDKQLATAATTVFRQREIIKAGGAAAVARANAQKEGYNFDERVQQEYRTNVVRIYYSKKVWPRVQITADDMREFYERNREQIFTQKAAVRFRVIRIGANVRGTRQQALEKAQELRQAVLEGKDFAALAAEQNDDSILKANAGYMDMTPVQREKTDENGDPVVDEKTNQPVMEPVTDAGGNAVREGAWYQTGSMANEQLEQAIFNLQSGQVTEIIEFRNGFYFAKLEEKRDGKVREFSDPDVQKAIYNKLQADQRQDLRRREISKLRQSAVVRYVLSFEQWLSRRGLNPNIMTPQQVMQNRGRYEEELYAPIVDMAMHKYYAWTRPSSAAAR